MNKKNLLKKMNILYVEDDLDTMETFSATLELVTNNLLKATDGKKALDIVKKEHVDIIITDLHMPNMNGIEFTNQVRKTDKDIPIIFLTAHSNVEYMLEAIDKRIVKYLIKPVEIENLINVLADIAYEHFSNENIIKLQNGIIIDMDQNLIQKENEEINLTLNESIFIELLNKHSPHTVAEENVLKRIWEEEAYSKKDALYSLVAKLRKKIGKESIVNISKVGYKLN